MIGRIRRTIIMGKPEGICPEEVRAHNSHMGGRERARADRSLGSRRAGSRRRGEL